jgi:hypothetical protein
MPASCCGNNADDGPTTDSAARTWGLCGPSSTPVAEQPHSRRGGIPSPACVSRGRSVGAVTREELDTPIAHTSVDLTSWRNRADLVDRAPSTAATTAPNSRSTLRDHANRCRSGVRGDPNSRPKRPGVCPTFAHRAPGREQEWRTTPSERDVRAWREAGSTPLSRTAVRRRVRLRAVRAVPRRTRGASSLSRISNR